MGDDNPGSLAIDHRNGHHSDRDTTIYLSDQEMQGPSLVLPPKISSEDHQEESRYSLRSNLENSFVDHQVGNPPNCLQNTNAQQQLRQLQNTNSLDEDEDDQQFKNSTEQSDDYSSKEDEVEPKLTYSRLRGDVIQIRKTEFITCMAVHEKFYILGTQTGKLFVLNSDGIVCCNPIVAIHQSAINQISIDEKADFIASCSDFKIAIINELNSNFNSDPYYQATFDRPVKTFSIDPQYSHSNARRFVIGEADRVLLYEKNLIGRYKVTCLQQARGIVRATSWRRNFIVWSSDLCMKIYDVQGKTIITHLDREKERDYRINLDLFQCRFSWKDDRTLLVVWGNSVKICGIIPKNPNHQFGDINNELPLPNLPKYYVELIYSFNIEPHLIACGIAPLEDRLFILCANKSLFYPSIGDDLKEKKFVRIKMVEPLNADLFTDISDDILKPNELLKTVQKSSDINIIHYGTENIYLIFCPKDVIIAKPLGEDDSIDWLLSRSKFHEAFERVRSNKKCLRHSYETVGLLYIEHLLALGTLDSCEEAGNVCKRLCQENSELWERQMNLFKQHQCLRVLTKHLPVPPAHPILKPHLYEVFLNEFLQDDSIGYLNLIRSWPSHLYCTSTMINHTTNRLSSQPTQDQNLLEALAELYAYECRYQKALFIFLQVGNAKKVFDLIWKHQLLHLLEDRIVELLQLDPEETSRLLIMNQDMIPSEKIISRLRKHPRLLCAYLDRLNHRDPTSCAPYHDLLFDLYATNEPSKIVPFLRQSNYIQLEKALNVCKKQNLTKAVVFILGRMGNTHEALRIIIEKMDNINAAIEFCKEHGDADLWAELMDISVSKPQLLSTLLREVGTYAADPIGLIARIPEGLEVPDLVPSLVKILQDYRLMVTLEDGCRRVLNSDCYNLFDKLYKMRSKAVVVRDQERYCHSCQLQHSASPTHSSMYTGGECVLFQCGHLFHAYCLQFNHLNDNSSATKQQRRITSEKLCLICQTKEKQTSIIPVSGSSSSSPTNVGNNQNSSLL